MIEVKLTWRTLVDRYSTGETLRAGRWDVGKIYYDGLAKGYEPKYAVSCNLPGKRSNVKNFTTPEEAKAKLESIVRLWFKGASE